MFVKICGVTNAEDALLAAGLGADAVGMIFAASTRRIAIAEARDVVHRLPPEVTPVGVFRNERVGRVAELANSIGLRAVQLHGDESPDDTRWLVERVPAVIKAFAIDDPALARHAEYGAQHVLIDSPLPGSGTTFDWAALERAGVDRPFILAGGLTPENVAQAITTVGPWGVDVASGVEASPGRKDPARLRQFMAEVRRVAPRQGDEAERGLFAGLGLPIVDRARSSSDPDASDDLRSPDEIDDEEPFNWEEDASWQ